MAFGILYGLRLSGIYKITNTAHGKFYVGSSVQIESRIFKHLCQLRKGKHNNGHLQSAYSLDGEDAFDFMLLEECDRADLLTREQHYMDALKPEYNICRVAGNTLGVLHTPASRAKMSAANIGNARMLGKQHTEETKRLIGSLAGQRRHTEEAKAKISKAGMGNKSNTGKTLTAEHVAKVAAASRQMWNGLDAEARREAASLSSKARWADPVWRLLNAQKITDGKKAAKLARRQAQ
jgi:group I intron endonuclease